MNCSVKSGSSVFIPVVDVDSPLNQVVDDLEGPCDSLLFRKKLFARMCEVGDVLGLDEEVD